MGGDVSDVLKKGEKKFKQAFDPRNLLPDAPEFPEFPEFPTSDARQEQELKQAIINRLRRSTIRGTGTQATIGTSSLGVTTPTQIRRPRAAGR